MPRKFHNLDNFIYLRSNSFHFGVLDLVQCKFFPLSDIMDLCHQSSNKYHVCHHVEAILDLLQCNYRSSAYPNIRYFSFLSYSLDLIYLSGCSFLQSLRVPFRHRNQFLPTNKPVCPKDSKLAPLK